MKYMSAKEAKDFASKWLPAWSGNRPELLVSFYANDVFYLDPAVNNGIKGKSELLAYFKKLLAKNPDWVWTQIEGIPMQQGFLNKWLAKIPVGTTLLEITGVCLVQINAEGLIARNEVYFDRSELFSIMAKEKKKG